MINASSDPCDIFLLFLYVFMMFEVIDPGNFAIFNEPNTFTLAVFCCKRDRFVEEQEQIWSLNGKRRKKAFVKMASDSSGVLPLMKS